MAQVDFPNILPKEDRLGMVKSAPELLDHGNMAARKLALEIITRSITAIDSYALTKEAVKLSGHSLTVAGQHYDLTRVRHVYVVGAGKATMPMASALEEILGLRISKGQIVVKLGQLRPLRRIAVTESDHPLPSREGLEGAESIVRIANEAGEDDLVFCLVTGGASALLPFPVQGISLEDKRRTTEFLLRVGADVNEINCVRNHLSQIKGGKLAEKIHPARIINLVVVDEIDRKVWGPSAPDNTTFEDALDVLHRYGLWNKVPSSVRQYIKRGLRDQSLETLKDYDFAKFQIQNVILADNVSLCEGAEREARRLGLNPLILTTSLRGESSQVGAVLGRIALEIESFRRPARVPCAIIAGGETTVTLGPRHGEGGPSQELALAAAREIRGSQNIVIAAIDTDGTDGPTSAAGGLVDGKTFDRISNAGIDPLRSLRLHDSYNALAASNDVIVTGSTGTNVMDLNLAIVTDSANLESFNGLGKDDGT